MKQFLKKHKSSIFVSIISTLLFIYFLEPIIRILGKGFIFLIRNLSSTVYNRIFQEVAFGRPDYSHTLLFLTTIVILTPTIFLIVLSLRTEKSKPSEELQEIESTQQTNEFNSNREEKIENKKTSLKKLKIPLLAIMLLISIGALILGDIKLKTIQSFEQHIRILTPYMETHKKELLISKFASMNSHDDYILIQSELNRIAEQNGITLPESVSHFF